MSRSSLLFIASSVVFMGVMVWKSSDSKPTGAAVAIEPVPSAVTTTTVAGSEFIRVQRGAPLSLTASDGTGLALSSMVARAEVQDPLAFTELRLTFQNPQQRQLEGTFRITLPPGATVSRFAMKIGGRWQEGEVVEKQAARVAYEDFLHRKQDPALLEQAGGNEFSARVFPIPANGVKEIILSYSQELTAAAPYYLPLRGLPQLGLLDVSVVEGGATRPLQTLVQRNTVPSDDFVLDGKLKPVNPGLRAKNMVLAKIRAQGETTSDPVDGAIVLVDTSASRALGYHEQVDITAGVVKRLADSAKGPFRVAAFDQVVVPIFAGAANEFGDKEIDALEKRLPLGASNLERALQWAGEEAKKAGITRVIVVGDGVTTAGHTEDEEFTAALHRLKDSGVARVDAIAVGGIQDGPMLHRLVSGTFTRDGMVIDGAMGAGNAVRRLNGATLAKVTIDVPEARWFWPSRLTGVQTGDEVMVYADVPENTAFRVAVDGKPPTTPDLRSAEEPLLERAWVQAQIASLAEAHAADPKPELVKDIIDLSVNHRVLSPFTALLVLETEQDYARFKIDRKALKDVLSMESGRLVATHRSWPFDRAHGRDDRDDEIVEGKNKGGDQPGRGKADKAEATATKAVANAAPIEAPADGRPPAPSEEPMVAPAARPTMAPPSSPRPASRAQLDTNPWADSAGIGGGGLLGGSTRSPDNAWNANTRQPYTGSFRDVMNLLANKTGANSGLVSALAWHKEAPGDVLALIALGEAYEANGDNVEAARAYGSLVDLFSARADLRRFAGERLEHLKDGNGLELAIDTYEKAVAQRPDHPASHRLLAFALLRHGDLPGAFDAALKGARRTYPEGRFAGVDRILREDLGLIGAAWLKKDPSQRAVVLQKLGGVHASLETAPSLRFVMNWETDANDVDFHIMDAKGGHAYYGHPELESGGQLYADVTTGYGPECFTIRQPKGARSGPYKLQAHYYSRGPMGYGMGKLEIIDHDGRGGLTFQERPYVVMVDHAFLDLGTVAK
jgi:tetratricopeptide (TPR) repeat protein